MSDNKRQQAHVVELLQQIGLKAYEAKCFTALTRLEEGTAKEISDVVDVPRTRVYDACNQLEERGLIEVQQSSPQRYRAIPVGEAIQLLRQQFDRRFEDLADSLEGLESSQRLDEETKGVWMLSGRSAIDNRTRQLLETAAEEVVIVLGQDLTDRLAEQLRTPLDQEVDVFVGTFSDAEHERVEKQLPNARVFESGLEWLQPADAEEREEIGRILLVDRDRLLLSARRQYNGTIEETGVWSAGFGNGLVVLARRLLATGLDQRDD